MAKYEHELSAFDGLGLGDVAMDDERWWAEHAPLLERVLDGLAALIGDAP